MLVPRAAGRDGEAAGAGGGVVDGVSIAHVHVAAGTESVRVDAAEAGALAYVHVRHPPRAVERFVGGTLLFVSAGAAADAATPPCTIDVPLALQLRVLGTCEERAHAYATHLCAVVGRDVLPHDVLRYHVGGFV